MHANIALMPLCLIYYHLDHHHMLFLRFQTLADISNVENNHTGKI